MSKSQEKTATGNAENQNLAYNQNAQTSYNAAQQDVGDYQDELAKYAASNPFTAGGAYQTAQNQQLADTAAASAQAAQQAAQSAAVRSGGNPAAAIAAGEQAAEVNARTQMGDVAQANQSRIAQGAQYGQNVLNASAVPEQMEAGLAGQQGGLGNSALSNEVNAAKTPSYLDELINGGIDAASKIGAGYAQKLCWIAARLFGGWLEPETLLLRLWMTYSFGRRWYGRPIVGLYGKYGERVANRMPGSPRLTTMMGIVFHQALGRAEKWSRSTYRGALLFNEAEELLRLRRITAPIQDEKAVADWLLTQAGEVL